MPSHHKPKGRSKNAGGNGGWKAVGAEKAKADKLAAVPEACTVDQASTTNSSFFDFDALDGSAKAEAVEANNAKHEVNEVEESQQAPVPDLVTTVAQEEAEAVVANNAKHEVGEVEESHQAPVPALVTTVAQDEAWLHMSSSARLKYKIVKCTSEDPEYPVSELLAHSSTTKGWQTGRFCDFPQEIGLQFETPVHLRQVQFLSHQSKIATKIELFTALPAEGQNCRYETAQFKRLGYLSLDSNERSQFQARELKSVYVDVSAQFLRVVLHKCHVNRYNIVNQVGLIALHCSGEVLGPDLSVGPPPPNPALARNNIVDNSQAAAPAPAQRAAAMPEARAAVAPGPPPAVSANAMDHAPEAGAQAAADEMRYDARTLERIRQLTTAKQRAVEDEDYEEAKRCKELLTHLRKIGVMLRDLEDRKRAAVQNEDYEAAKSLKVEIDRLHSSIERPPQHQADGRERGNSRASPIDPPVNSMGDFDSGKSSAFAQPPAQATAPRGAHQPVMNQAPGSGRAGHYDAGGGLGGNQLGSSQGRLAAAAPDVHSPMGSPQGGYGSPQAMNSYMDEPSQPGPPMPFEGGTGSMPSRAGVGSPPLMGARAGSSGGMQGFGGGGGAPNPQGLERERSSTSEAAHHLRGVPNVEDILTSPDPLTPALEGDKECQLLLKLFGDYITRCIYSKTWNLRDAALQKLALDLREGARRRDDPAQLLQGYTTILKRTIADKNVQVNLSSGGLAQAVCQVLLETGPVRRNDAQPCLESLMPLLVERLGEPNARVDKTARDALLDFARCQSVGALFTTQYLLKPPKKKTGAVHARVFSSRLQVLTALASEFGVQPESRDGVPLESTAQLAMEWFNNRDADVRENSIKLIAACYSHVGLRRIEGYLANLRPAQREAFDAEFERVSGSAPSPSGASHVGRAQASPPFRGQPRVDDGYDDVYGGGLPAPAVPPPRQGGGGQFSSGPAPTYPQENEFEDDYDEPPEFTCQFCGRQDPTFTPDALDVHYWRDCPMLNQCEFCQQVIEICMLRSHMAEECEKGAPAQARAREIPPHQCPLCRADVGRAEDSDWRQHLLGVGCPGNSRSRAGRR